MNEKRKRFFVISAVATALVVSPQVFAQTSSPATSTQPFDAASFFNTTFWQNIAVAVLTAVLAFLCGYALAGMSRRKGSGKKLSYNLSIANSVVQVDKEVKERVKILYNNELIDNLYNVEFELENTGDMVIKSQEIRFEFPDGTRILDFSFAPEPEPEMSVSKIDSGLGLKPNERKCRIGQIEKGQKVGIQFAATNASGIQEVKAHSFNEIGDVEFSAREIAKQLSDKEQLTKFLIYSIFYLLIPPIFDSFPVLYGQIMAGAVRLLILFNLFKVIAPFSEAVADLITRIASFTTRSVLAADWGVGIGENANEAVIVTGNDNTVTFFRNKSEADGDISAG
jgi:hypothetical protein